MIIETIYIIGEPVSETYTPIFFARNNVMARRQFGQFLSGKNMRHYNPKDFCLYNLGTLEIDNEAGSWLPYVVPSKARSLVCTGSELTESELINVDPGDI